jgi:hypothetical protein
MEEIWKEYLPGYYEVSNLGRFRSMDRYVKGQIPGKLYFRQSKILPSRFSNRGYLRVTLHFEGKDLDVNIHRAVAEAFVENLNNLPEVNHIGKDENGFVDKTDNRAISLEWVTASENHLHAHREGLKASGSNHTNSILTEESVIDIKELLREGFTQKEIAKQFGVHCGTISGIATGASWKHVK